MLERDSELTRIGAALARAAAGEGGVLVVEGPPGAGKSALLEQARRAAREQGVAVRRARAGSWSGSSRSGSSASCSSPSWTRSRRTSPVPALGSIAAAVARLARERPLLLAVDDVQWADRASLRALDHLAARLDDLPVLVVLGLRTGVDGEEGLDALLVRAADTLRPARSARTRWRA